MNDLRSQNRTLTPVPELGPKTGEIVTNPAAKRSRARSNPLFESSRSVEEPEADGNGVSAGRPAVERPYSGAAVQPEAQPEVPGESGVAEVKAETLSFPVSRDLRSMPVSATKRSVAPPDNTDSVGSTNSADRKVVSAEQANKAVSVEAEVAAESAATADHPITSEDAITSENAVDGVPIGAGSSVASRGRNGGAKAPASRPNKRREVAEVTGPEDDKFPWHHQFDDDEPEELLATSPLLSRAFRSSVG